MLSSLFSFNQIFHIASAVDSCRDTRLQSLIRKNFFNQKWNKFLKIINWYDKQQENINFFGSDLPKLAIETKNDVSRHKLSTHCRNKYYLFL